MLLNIVELEEMKEKELNEKLSFISRSEDALEMRSILGRALTRKELLSLMNGQDEGELLSCFSRSEEALKVKYSLGRELTRDELIELKNGKELERYAL